MPITTSLDHPVALGTECPNFTLKRVDTGAAVTRDGLASAKGDKFKGLVAMFICNHCPVCSHCRPKISEVAKEYEEKGFAFIGIMPHELGVTPMNGPDEMKAEIDQFGYVFPYCFDGDCQKTSRDIGAVTTPDIFVYDSKLKLVYRGSFDATRPANQGNFQPPMGADKLFKGESKVGAPSDGEYLKAALDALLEGKGSKIEQYASEGCSIKWLPDGNEPSYSKSEYKLPESWAFHRAWNRKYFFWKHFYNFLYFFLGFFGYKRPAIGSELKQGGI